MNPVLTLAEVDADDVARLLADYQLDLERVARDRAIPGSFWGDPEAGLRGDRLYARDDTPLHSILHEACHYICMSPRRRASLDTDAGGGYDEENAVCYLQILLADRLPGFGRERALRDMDAWGYSFRLGSARAWFEEDAQDALEQLRNWGLVDGRGHPRAGLRTQPDAQKGSVQSVEVRSEVRRNP